AFDREKMMQEAQNSGEDFRGAMQTIESLSLEELQYYATSEHVSNFLYSSSVGVSGNDDVEAVTTESSSSTQTGMKNPMQGMGGSMSQGDFTLVGYSDYNSMSDFVSGTSKVSEGEIFNLEDNFTCVISTQLAAYNNLSVGDTLILSNPNDESQLYEYTITGLYTYTSEDSGFNQRFSTAMDPANQIYTSFDSLASTQATSVELATTSTNDMGMEQSSALVESLSASYSFVDVAAYEQFVEDVRTMGLSDSYSVSSSDLTSYEAQLVPIQNTANFANMMLWVVLGVGALILIVLNLFTIRERKYEVGVLMAIGMKKYKVAMQFVLELVVVSLVAILLGSGLGAVLSVPVSNQLLAANIASQQTQSQQQSENFGRPGQSMPGMGGAMSPVGGMDYVSELQATTDFGIMIQLIGIGLLLSIIASLGAVVFVMRYEPLKILSDRT
ncbi:MAG: ABC transporter permease, partial [Erysipelotrichaceae bacterium]